MRDDTGTNPAATAGPAWIRLPPRPTRLIGREREIADLRALLLRADIRLVTITGPPGVGKTRLALEIGAAVTGTFDSGVVFVDLSTIRDPALVPYAIVHGLGIRDEAMPQNRTPTTSLTDFLQGRNVLLILDNFEQVVDASPLVGELLGTCSALKVLATSRVPLHLAWEHEYPVSPLPVSATPAQPVSHSPAVRLLAERVQAVRPDFVLDERSARVAQQICSRLDGLPLAIELIAAQAKHFALPILLERLNRGLEALVGGWRDLPPRHRTLRDAIAWSYDLLPPDQQVLFRRLAVFAGSFSVEAAAAVCTNDLALDPYTAAAALSDHNLLRRESFEREARFSLLQSLREFGREKLESTGEAAALYPRLLSYFVGLAEQAGMGLAGPDDLDWYARLEMDYDNLRQTMAWALSHGEVDAALRLASSLRTYWIHRGHIREARGWLEEGLALAGGVAPSVQAGAFFAAGYLAWVQGDSRTSREHFEQSLRISRDTNDPAGICDALTGLSRSASQEGDRVTAERLLRESLTLCRAAQDPHRIGTVLSRLGRVLAQLGRLEEAKAELEESHALAQRLGDRVITAVALNGRAMVAAYQGNFRRAKALFEELHVIDRELGVGPGNADSLNSVGEMAMALGQLDEAYGLFNRSLAAALAAGAKGQQRGALVSLAVLSERRGAFHSAAAFYRDSRALGDEVGVLTPSGFLEAAAGVAVGIGNGDAAALLMGAAEAHREREDSAEDFLEEWRPRMRELRTQRILAALGEEEMKSGWAQGRATSFEEAVRTARTIIEKAASQEPPAVPSLPVATGPLSRREHEVAALVAQGLSNREIAKRLFISERTADTHVQHILNKLGFNSRTQIAAWAVEHGLTSPLGPTP